MNKLSNMQFFIFRTKGLFLLLLKTKKYFVKFLGCEVAVTLWLFGFLTTDSNDNNRRNCLGKLGFLTQNAPEKEEGEGEKEKEEGW